MNEFQAAKSRNDGGMRRLDRVGTARRLLDAYERRTGVAEGDGEAAARRYLWTDALAVSVEIRLSRHLPEADRSRRASRLATLVHEVLGSHRSDDPRSGRLPGADDAHPTAGGLRIGKPLPERLPGEAFDERLEWERDGQYFHYLTKWMHALVDLGEVGGEVEPLVQARDLADAAGRAFIERDAAGRPVAISWKRSIDLRRTLVAGGGGLDPLDGLATFARVAEACRGAGVGHSALRGHLEDFTSLCVDCSGWATADPLGIGGILGSAITLLDVLASGEDTIDRKTWFELVGHALLDALAGIEAYERSRRALLGHRPGLGFRELGLSGALHAVGGANSRLAGCSSAIGDASVRAGIAASLEALARAAPRAEWIERSWAEVASRGMSEWRDHLDINEVSLAWSLLQGEA